MLTYDFKLGKSVRVHHGITAVLRRGVPGPYRHCENGASIRNLKTLAIFCGYRARSGREPRRRGSIDTNTDRMNAIAQETNGIAHETKMKALIRDYKCYG